MINANKDLFQLDKTDPASEQLADKALKRITGQKVEGEVRGDGAGRGMGAGAASQCPLRCRRSSETHLS